MATLSDGCASCNGRAKADGNKSSGFNALNAGMRPSPFNDEVPRPIANNHPAKFFLYAKVVRNPREAE
jgi:hypothetical protein